MTIEHAIYLLLALLVYGLFVWLLVTYVAKSSPAREIVIAVAVILLILVLILVLLNQYGHLLRGHL